jgi:hypothetical protein
VSYPDYVDSRISEILSVVPGQAYTMYPVSNRAGLTEPPPDGRWQGGSGGLGDEVIRVHYVDALAAVRAHNAALHARIARGEASTPPPGEAQQPEVSP